MTGFLDHLVKSTQLNMNIFRMVRLLIVVGVGFCFVFGKV